MACVADAVREEVTIAISKDQLQLPTLPEVALKIHDAAEREDISAADLAEVIGEDPSLAARVLKVANSPMYRGAREIETIGIAVSRLGMDYTCNLVSTVLARNFTKLKPDQAMLAATARTPTMSTW